MKDRTLATHDSNRAQKTRNPTRAAGGIRQPDELENIASRWVVLNTAGEPNELDRHAFSAWYVADVRHAQMYDELMDIWYKLSALDAGAIGAKRKRRGALRSLAVLTFVIIGSALLCPDSLPVLALADTSTAIGEVRTIRLADGSSAVLDAQSAIAVQLTLAARNIRLLRGRVAKPGRRAVYVL
jgi:transmembrane sensor